MNPIRGVVLGLLCLAQISCSQPAGKSAFPLLFPLSREPAAGSSTPSPTSQPQAHPLAVREEENREGTRGGQTPVMLETQFEVMRVSVPLSAVTASRDVWNLIDEQVLPVSQIELLRRNGLRVGVVDAANLPALKVALGEMPEAKSNRYQIVLKNAYPLELGLDHQPRSNTIFFYRADGSSSGASYPDSRRYLHFAHSLRSENLEEVILRLTPEIRQERRELRWEATPFGLERVAAYKGKVFSEVSAEVRIPAGSVLVLGASPAAANPVVLGGAFLTEQDEGDEARHRETVYLVAPRAVRSTMAQK